MDLYSELSAIRDTINSNHEYSYEYLCELKENNTLDSMFESHNIASLFRKEFLDFISIFENPNYEYHEYLRKIHLNESSFLNSYGSFGYLLSLFLNDKNSYRTFPLFFKEAVDYFNIEKYSNITLEEIDRFLNKYLDLDYNYSYKYERELCDVIGKVPGMFTTYSKYDYKLNNKQLPINCMDKEEFFVYSEYEAYARELYNLNSYHVSDAEQLVRWVARYDGDGYGYDVLSYDIFENKEKLIEVKSGVGSGFDLTRIEYKTLLSTINNKNSDYYIYRYFYDISTKFITLSMLKFDKNTKDFEDIITKERYKLIPYFMFDEYNIQRVKVDVVKEEMYNEYLKR